MVTPKPIATQTVCSVCELDWDKHATTSLGLESTLEECVRLLKAELKKRPAQVTPFRTPPSPHWGFTT